MCRTCLPTAVVSYSEVVLMDVLCSSLCGVRCEPLCMKMCSLLNLHVVIALHR